jgi:lipopolysaccharide transport system ATP-binding protein
MYVRLAFAVAAHLESEILIVDEVLAVGDAEFQKKCLGKMGNVSKGEGRTVLFVSHNMTAVKTLCNNGIVLENGMVKYIGDVNKSILEYNSHKKTTKHSAVFSEISDYSNEIFKLKKITLTDINKQELETIDEIVLYAIKRLESLFKMPFDSFDGKKELITLFDLYKKSNNRHWPVPVVRFLIKVK